MSDLALDPAAPALSEPARIIDTFVAPTKTFTDILRSAAWWGPFLLMCILAMASTFTVDKKVGWDAVTAQQIAQNKSASEQMDQLPADQKAKRMKISATISKYIGYSIPLFILLASAVIVLVLWLSVNFGLGAQTKFSQMFAVWMYASLPKIFITLLNIILLWAGVGLDNYDIKNPVGTNLGYFLGDSAAWLKELGSWLDIFNLWALFLLVIGVSIVAKKTKAQAATVVVGWWVLLLLLSVGWKAAMG